MDDLLESTTDSDFEHHPGKKYALLNSRFCCEIANPAMYILRYFDLSLPDFVEPQ